MFILKIIVISSAVLNIGLSTTQCDSGQFMKFNCQEPNCKSTPLSNEPAKAISLIKTVQSPLKILGFNDRKYLVENEKGKLLIVDINSIKIQSGSIGSKKHWSHQVNIHKTNFEVCGPINENNKENYSNSNIDKMSTNTVETSDGIVIDDVDENEENMANVNHIQESINIDVSDSDPINHELNNLNETIKQNITNESISNQKLENNSSTDCLLGSCEKGKIDVESIVSVNMENSNQQTDNNKFPTQQLSNTDKIDSSIDKSTNNIELQKSNTNSSQENNIASKNITNSTLMKMDNTLQIDQLSLNKNETTSLNEDNMTTKTNKINSHPQNISIVSQNTQELSNTEQTDNQNKILTNNMNELNETQEISKEDLVQANTVPINQQSNTNYTLEETNVTKEIISDVLDENDLQNSTNTLVINEIQKQSNVNDNSEINETNDHIDPGSHNIPDNNLSKSTILNTDSVNGNITDPSSLKELMNETDIGNVDVTKGLNQKPIDECTTGSECLNSMDEIPKNDYEGTQYTSDNKGLAYTTIQKPMEHNNDKPNKLEYKNFIMSSFHHPDACSGVNCLNFNKNVEKKIRSSPSSNILTKQMNPDTILHSTNTDFEKDNQNTIKQLSEESTMESSLLDHFQNWISSPTLNSVDFLLNIFKEYSSAYHYYVYPDQRINNLKNVEHTKLINNSEFYFITMAVVTLLFSLIYYKYQKGTYESDLLTLLAAKDQNLLIVEKELLLLKEQNSGNTISTIERNSEIETLNEHLTKSENIISSQAIRIEKLEEEVEELTESGMEMHTLLSSAMESSAKSTDKLNNLKIKLIDSENLVTTLTQKNFEKTTELEKMNDVIKSLKTTIDEITKKNISLIEDNSKISLQLEEVLTKSKLKESKLQSKISNLQFEIDKQINAFITVENEAKQSKDTLQEMLSHKFNQADANKLLSSVKFSAEIKSANKKCERYKQKLDESIKLNQQYLDHIEVLKSDVEKLENNFSKLEEKKEESENKLIILTKFFKEQEKEYLKQINEKALLFDNKEEESSDLHERIKSLNQEIFNYKSEIQSLKKEITDQEASFKIQISAADKKASDCWISFRQAERKLKEMELETAQLRNKLTMVDKKLENGTKSIDSSKDYEDELLDIPLPIISPDFTLLDFEPPPPIFSPSLIQQDSQMFPSSLQHASADQRLPPLGALGQASSPPPPLSRRHNRSLSPGSPPPSSQRSSIFRPLPQRYNYINRQNSLGHSVESLDK